MRPKKNCFFPYRTELLALFVAAKKNTKKNIQNGRKTRKSFILQLLFLLSTRCLVTDLHVFPFEEFVYGILKYYFKFYFVLKWCKQYWGFSNPRVIASLANKDSFRAYLLPWSCQAFSDTATSSQTARAIQSSPKLMLFALSFHRCCWFR